jgi:hypothetical protein
MDRVAAESFVVDWLRAWNEHNVDEVLSHFSEEVIFTSPVAVQLIEAVMASFVGRRRFARIGWRGSDEFPVSTSTSWGSISGSIRWSSTTKTKWAAASAKC